MSALDRVIQYFIEGDISEHDLTEYLVNVGMLPVSRERVLKQARYKREQYKDAKKDELSKMEDASKRTKTTD